MLSNPQQSRAHIDIEQRYDFQKELLYTFSSFELKDYFIERTCALYLRCRMRTHFRLSYRSGRGWFFYGLRYDYDCRMIILLHHCVNVKDEYTCGVF